MERGGCCTSAYGCETLPGELRAVTFLDSSVIIDMLAGVPDVVKAVEERGQPYLTSSLCAFEVIADKTGSGEIDVVAVCQQFGGVRALDWNEKTALEAARMQDTLMDNGERLAARDLLITATARSTGNELIVADEDFETDSLTEMMDVTNLRRDD